MSASKEAPAYKAEGEIPGTKWTTGSSYSSLYLKEQQEPLDLSMKHKPADSVLTMKPLSDNIKVDMTDDQLVSENDASRRNGECVGDPIPNLEKSHVSRVDINDSLSRRNSMTTDDESRQQSSDSATHKSKDVAGEDALGLDKPFICKFLCGYRSKYKCNVARHERIHTGAKPYVCPVDRCGQRFKDSSNLAKHSRIHTGEKPFVCTWEACEKRFTRYFALTEHARIHTEEKPYLCTWDGCEKLFRQYSNFSKHMKTYTTE